ncbi:uncharacterized protein F5891DRAFT_1129161 [Suillus fuscotomentosus]|uniref:Uncharacterized protein n=1 Tax=Suillus fuscotomentosus TaxID=1912939 RepID=A0AAD4E3U0_9AGAM|nr:uncharacterized protein F5891DRAFT_1129161 [Suillus fuscotomentosus]KAG1899229.1 hypothetical protein F5891DRAFT_1129161 [Suillus fuscotomentosus]
MSGDENHLSGDPSRKRTGSALYMAPRKKVSSSNPLILHGRHFGRTVFALCNYPALLTAGVLRLEESPDCPIEDYPADVRREHIVFMMLVESYPGLLDRLTNGEEEDLIHVGELLGDDTKTLKSTVLEWLVPRGQVVIPPLSRNIKSDRGFNHEVTGMLLCPTGLDWLDAETKAKLKSGETAVSGDQWPGFKHIFTSPSSVDKEPKATCSGNAYLHSMKSVTKGSLAYIATQVLFSLSLSSVFSCTNTVTDSENFYHSILDLLEDPDESEEVNDLMVWWTRKNSALAKIRERRAALRERATAGIN